MAVSDVLQRMRDEYGLDLVAIVGTDGLLVESAHDPVLDAESVAANAVSGLLMMEALGRELGGVSARQAIVEFDEHVVLVTPLGQDTALVVVAAGSANLGRLRLAVRRARGTLEQEAATI